MRSVKFCEKDKMIRLPTIPLHGDEAPLELKYRLKIASRIMEDFGS